MTTVEVSSDEVLRVLQRTHPDAVRAAALEVQVEKLSEALMRLRDDNRRSPDGEV